MDQTPQDIARTGWTLVTLRVAWTLRSMGIQPRGSILDAARRHVWMQLPADTPVHVAEDRAEQFTRQFVAHGRGQRYEPPYPGDQHIELKESWRREVHHARSGAQGAVMLHHYANGLPIHKLAATVGCDAAALLAAREGIRERLRFAAASDDVSLEKWSEARLDHLIHRLANLPVEPPPPLLEVVDGLHPDKVNNCLRSRRAYQLVRRNGLDKAQLRPPAANPRPDAKVRFLALHIHPDGRRHLETLRRSLQVRHIPRGDSTLLISTSDPESIRQTLHLAAEVECPSREHMRGTFLEGTGQWSRFGLLGPLPETVDDKIRSLSWGQVEGMGELPEPLPPPPSTTRSWLVVTALILLMAGLLSRALAPLPPPVAHPLRVVTTPARGGMWVEFDVHDQAHVAVVREAAGHLEVLVPGQSPVDKANHATGDGRFRLHTQGQGVAVISSASPLTGLADALRLAEQQPESLKTLASALQKTDSTIDVVWDTL